MAGKTHWRRLSNTDYIGAYALEEGKDLIATIKSVNKEIVVSEGGKKEEKRVIHFIESNLKPFVCNEGNGRIIARLYGSYIEDWVGKKIQFYIGISNLKGEPVEALKVRPFVPQVNKPKEKIEYCSECQKEIKAYGNKNATQLAKYTLEKYNKMLCAECASKAAKSETEKENVSESENTNTEANETISNKEVTEE